MATCCIVCHAGHFFQTCALRLDLRNNGSLDSNQSAGQLVSYIAGHMTRDRKISVETNRIYFDGTTISLQ